MKLHPETIGAAVIFGVLWIAASLGVIHVINEQRREARQQSALLSVVSNELAAESGYLRAQNRIMDRYGIAFEKVVTEVSRLNGMYRDLSNLTVIYTLPHDDESRSNQTAPAASSPGP